ncbi:MAG: hypothetical protein ACE5DX_00600 [Candidatus Dojkabacteria bacterium]
MINGIDTFQVITYIIFSTLLTGVIAFPLIALLYKFDIVRHFDVDFSALIESRKEKAGTPIMGGLMIILPIAFMNLIANFDTFTDIPIVIFVLSALLGGIDDVLNIYGKARKLRPLSRVRKLIAVHKSQFMRFKLVLTYPWAFYSRLVHVFESHPGKGLFAHERLLVQTALGLLLGYWFFTSGVVLDPGFVWLPFIGGINISFLVIPFATFTLVAMTNAVNITDGMDGLSAGILLPAFGGFLVIATLEGNTSMALLTGTVIGSLVMYLYFNVAPARVQMGDVGAFALGSLLTTAAFALDKPILLLAFGLPFVIEIASVVIQSIYRRFFGRRFFRMAPLHHHFELLGWSEEKVVMRFWLFAIASMLLGVWIYFL